MSRTFVVFADSFDENNGGVIALHRLCDLLNRSGHRALLWPSRKSLHDPQRPWASAWGWFRFYRRAWRRPYRTCTRFDTPIATPEDLPGAIVVYPEIVSGNPLRAAHVVRWLLHKPGFHKGAYVYGANDRYFYYQKAFDDPALNRDPENLLKVIYLRDDVYRQTHVGPRHGIACILRKGKGRPMVHDTRQAIVVDKLSHAELAAVCNRVEMCVSYDTYTMYSMFAALCGCVSVVVPEPGVTKEQWYPDPRDRYGLAYGFDDIEHARATQPLLLAHLKSQESAANESVQTFVEKCAAYFPP